MVYKYEPKDMQFKHLGRTGLKVSVFSYGGWLTVGGTVKGDPVKDLIKTALDHGVNFFDNAEIYANGQSEIEMGRVFKELEVDRDQLVVSTKVFFGTGKTDPNQKGLSRKHIIEGVRASLKRLQLDYVDIVFAHRPDVATPMEEVVRGFNFLLDHGLTYYWGTSEWTAQQIQEAIGIADRLGLVGPVVEQPQYSIFHREKFEVEYKPLWDHYGYGSTIWSPLAGGELSGKYLNGIPENSRYKTNPDFYQDKIKELESPEGKKRQDRIRKLGDISKRLGGGDGPAALALAWAATSPHVSSVILGATKPEQLEENFQALKLLDKITPEIRKEIDELFENAPQQLPTYGRA
ncbi:uncharacterized protein JCM10292_002546 [Rhodotorula paludigena]|uniref:uncharacterized protein n=1 Tax=Rhodotorula paludigena TaxID=86838 RepID=UPI00317509C4